MKIIVDLTALYCSLFLLKLTFPFVLPIGTPILALLLLLYVRYILKTNSTMPLGKEITVLYLFLMVFILWGAVNSDRLYYNFLCDFRNAVTIFLLLPILGTICKNGMLDDFKSAFAKVNSITFFAVGLYSLYKFYSLLQGAELSWFIALDVNDAYPHGTSLQPDYNMASLGLLSAFLSSGYLLCYRSGNLLKKIFYASASILTLAAALLTGSRRAVAVSIIIIAVILIYQIIRKLNIFRISQFIERFSAKSALLVAICLPLLIFGVQLFKVWNFNVSFSDESDFEIISGRYGTLYGGIDTLRESRGWHFRRAMELINDMTIPQLIYGDGFDYLRKMSIEDYEDYPHNPILSAILYGGLLNCALTVVFISRSLFLYLKKIKTEQFFFLLLVLHLLFLLISSNSIFSSRSLMMLLVMPFLFNTADNTTPAINRRICFGRIAVK